MRGFSRKQARRPVGGRAADALMRVPVARVAARAAVAPDAAGDALMVLAACVLAAAWMLVQLDGPYDTDAWFLLAAGREVVESGFPLENPWAAQAGLGVVIQQWAHDVLLWLAWGAGGPAAVCALACAMGAGLALALFGAIGAVAPSRPAPAPRALLAALAVAGGCGWYVSARPTAWSMMALLAVVALCMRWRATGRGAWLAPLPLVALAQVQLQASLWMLSLFAAACFLLPDSPRALRGGGLRGLLASRLPLLAALLAMCAASLANPYGILGSLYAPLSVGIASYASAIQEMRPLLSMSPPVVCSSLSVGVALPALTMLLKGRPAPLPLLALWAAALAAALMHGRSVWILAIAACLVCGSLLAPSRAGERSPRAGVAAALLAGSLALGVAASAAWAEADGAGWGESDGLAPIARTILSEGGGKVFVETDWWANRLLFEGVPVQFDLRPELWEGAIPGVEGPSAWKAYVDAAQGGEEAMSAYVMGGGWDFLVVSLEDAGRFAESYGMATVEVEGPYVLMEPTEATASLAAAG